MAIFARIVRTLWVVIRFPLLAVLAICEPFVSGVLVTLALLMVLVAGLYACLTPFHSLPVFGLLATAVGSVLLLVIYGATVKLLSA